MEVNKGGRPKKNIDKKQFEMLCQYQCTKDEICGFFDLDEKTLTRWCKDTYGEGFSDIYKKKAVNGKISLRRWQFRQAENNVTMAIWLGKQMLGQKEKVEYQDTTNGILDDLKVALENVKKS